MALKTSNVRLPLFVMSMVDISRLQRELQAIDNFMVQSVVRKAGQQPDLPRTSRNLEEFAKANGFNLLLEPDRRQSSQLLAALHDGGAPIIHMSFASDPSAAFLTRLITWLRSEIHPLVLLQIGLQPSIAAGCIIRTRNKYFDFSLRKDITRRQQLLIDKIKEVVA